jgi:hypothetical protein
MKWAAIVISALLLGGCVSRSIPNLEDVPPTAQASTAPRTVTGSEQQPAEGSGVIGQVTGSGREIEPPAGQQPPHDAGVQGPVTDSGRAVEPPAEQQSAPTPGATSEATHSGRAVKLTAQQRSDIEQGVRRGLPGSNFGPMAATISRVTSKSYIVCGWVEDGEGYRPFLAMYVPYMRTALLVAVAGKQPEALIRQRCVDEGIQLPS